MTLIIGVGRSEAHIYWGDTAGDQISRAENDGTGVDSDFLWWSVGNPTAVAIDGTGIYWANNTDNSVRRANIDGSGETLSAWIPTGITSAWGVAIDSTYAYYTNIAGTSIGRKNRNTGVLDQAFITNTGLQPDSVTVSGSYIYWSHSGNAIGRANIDGTGADPDFISGLSGVRGIAVNGSYIYWAGDTTNGIGRANLNGTGVNQSFITGAATTDGIAVDSSHIYWTLPGPGRIARANLDGSGANTSFIQNAGNPVAVAVDSGVSPPTLTINSGPSGPTSNRTPSFGFTSSGVTLTCSIDQGTPAWTPCTSPYAPPESLADGDWTFRVHAVSSLGSEADQTRTFTVDGQPPESILDGTPNQFTNESTAYFDFHSTEPGSYFECDGGDDDWLLCSSPATIVQVSPGVSTFRVRATDSAGNVDPTPATFEFEMDQIKPETTIDSGPSGTITTSQADFAFSSNKSPAQFFCSIDGADAEACASTKTYTGLSDGQHEFRVYARDKFGNQDSTPDSRTFTVDTSGPVDPPSNAFTFGRLKLNTKQGTATLQVKVPGAGKVQLLGSKTVAASSKSARAKSTVTLAVKARGKATKTLKKRGKVGLAVKVRFTPTGGTAKTMTKTVKLVRKKTGK